MNKLLYQQLQTADDPELSDGAYWCRLEDAVREFNKTHGTSYDPHSAVLEYLSTEDTF